MLSTDDAAILHLPPEIGMFHIITKHIQKLPATHKAAHSHYYTFHPYFSGIH